MKTTLTGRIERIKLFIDNGYTADLETGLVYSPKPGTDEMIKRGCINNKGYMALTTKLNGKSIKLQAHHFIYYLATGKVVDELDHIDRTRHHNGVANLREVTHSENQQNKDEARGYYYVKKIDKYRVKLMTNGVRMDVGYFKTEEEAKQAYLIAKNKYHIQ